MPAPQPWGSFQHDLEGGGITTEQKKLELHACAHLVQPTLVQWCGASQLQTAIAAAMLAVTHPGHV